MKIDLSNLSYDGQWYEFQPGVELKIRPCPASMSNIVMRDGSMVISGEDQCRIFIYCLVDWKNVVDANDKPLPCSEEVKRKIFDFGLGGIAPFVLRKVRLLEEEKQAEEKN